MLAPAVLLVDDDEPTIELVAHVLRARGYRILAAKDADEALAAAASYDGSIPLPLTDVAMPDMNGLELAKGNGLRRPETKILYMTAYRHLFEVGSFHVLAKPFTPDQLLAKVQEVLSSPDDSSGKDVPDRFSSTPDSRETA